MFVLGRSIPDGPLVQGEILANLVQYRVDVAVSGQPVSAVPIEHDFCVVLTQICDLQHDFKARFSGRGDFLVGSDFKDKPQKYLLDGVLLCKVQKEAGFRDTQRGINKDVFSKAQKNSHERYHCLGPLRAHGQAEGSEYHLFLDFKRIWVCPPDALYAPLHGAPDTHRVGVVPPLELALLMQRFQVFHGRIGMPDVENDVPYLSVDPTSASRGRNLQKGRGTTWREWLRRILGT